MEKTIDLKKTKKKELFDLLRTLRQTNDHCLLRENGDFGAVVITREEYEKYLLRRQTEAQADLEKVLAKIHSQSDQNFSDEDLQKELDEAIHEMHRQHTDFAIA
jgi:hypothetical protein